MKRRRKNGRRNGIQPAALSALAAACVLLAAAHFGCDISAEAALSRLAHSRAFLSCMTALEFGVRADTAEVYVPRTAAAARDENAEAPQSESVYVPAAPQNTAPVLSAADKAATLTINNDTDYEVDVAACLAEDTHIRAAGEGPQVLVFHTHASESYTPDAAFPYTPTEPERTTDTRYNVVRVGDELCSALEERGIETVHLRSLFDTPTYAGSYDRSLEAVEQALAEYPSVKVVIDLHRDSILTDEGVAYRTSCTINGTETAQLMFVVGTDAGGLYHPDWRENLSFASTLQYALNRAYPSLMRPLNLRTQRFDQHASPGSLLIEVGSSGNTLPEALSAVRLFADVLADEMTG